MSAHPCGTKPRLPALPPRSPDWRSRPGGSWHGTAWLGDPHRRRTDDREITDVEGRTTVRAAADAGRGTGEPPRLRRRLHRRGTARAVPRPRHGAPAGRRGDGPATAG